MPKFKVNAMIMEAHAEEITQIICLTDFYCDTEFVTLSLDGQIRFFNEVGNLLNETEANG